MSFDRRIDRALFDLLVEDKAPEPQVDKPDCVLSKEQIDEHYENHYKEYLIGFSDCKKELQNANNPIDVRSSILGLSFNRNGIILHENYFSSLGNTSMPQDLINLINKSFSSRSKFDKLLKNGLMAARGWLLLHHDPDYNELMFNIVDDHDIHMVANRPILALDVWEHAFYLDFKSDKEKYVDLLISDIDWQTVAERLENVE